MPEYPERSFANHSTFQTTDHERHHGGRYRYATPRDSLANARWMRSESPRSDPPPGAFYFFNKIEISRFFQICFLKILL